MGCKASHNTVEVLDARALAGTNPNDQSVASASTKKTDESITKTKKKGWSFFGFKSKTKEVEPEPEEVNIRPKPQGRWYIKELKKTRTFGSSTLSTPNEWPTEEDLAKFDHYNQVQLIKISYKRKYGGNYPLAGIQFHMSNGIESPLYQTSDAIERDWPLETKEIHNKKRKIAKIQVRTREYAYIHKIKFLDKDDTMICELVFDDREEGTRQGQVDIPEDEGLVGIFCSTSESFPQCITRLGFILGKFEEQAPKEE